MQCLSGLLPAKVLSVPQHQAGTVKIGLCSQAWGQLRNVLFCSRFNTVDIHKINLLSEEINPIPCSHSNTSHAAQFSLGILWEVILPGPAASLAAQAQELVVGGVAAPIEECRSGI